MKSLITFITDPNLDLIGDVYSSTSNKFTWRVDNVINNIVYYTNLYTEEEFSQPIEAFKRNFLHTKKTRVNT